MTKKQIVGCLWRALIRKPKWTEDSFSYWITRWYVQATIKKHWTRHIAFQLQKICLKYW